MSAANVRPGYPSACQPAQVSSFSHIQGTVHTSNSAITAWTDVGEGGGRNLPLTGKVKIVSEINPLHVSHTVAALGQKHCHDKAFTQYLRYCLLKEFEHLII